MNLKNWFRKTFQKGQSMRVYLYHDDKRLTEHIVKRPSNHNPYVTIGESHYVVNAEKVFYYDGLPTCAYYSNDPDGVQPLEKSQQSDLTANDLYNAMEEKVSRDIIRYASNNDDDLKRFVMIGAGVSVLAVAGLGFFGFQELTTILEQQADMMDILDKLDNSGIEGGDYNERE